VPGTQSLMVLIPGCENIKLESSAPVRALGPHGPKQFAYASKEART